MPFVLDLETFLTNSKQQWESKQKEIESQFLQLSDMAAACDEPSPKRKKRDRTKCQPQVQKDPFASYAAQLQVVYFKKVSRSDVRCNILFFFVRTGEHIQLSSY